MPGFEITKLKGLPVLGHSLKSVNFKCYNKVPKRPIEKSHINRP